MRQIITVFWLAIFTFCLTGFALGNSVSPAAAQSTVEWTIPVNLSGSGAATGPALVVDSGGRIHVVWHDEIDGTVYTALNAEEWSEPIPIDTPFDTYTPLLVADARDRIYAFWTDDTGALFYSRVVASEFANSEWTSALQLTGSAYDYDVVVDSANRLHLVFVRAINSESAPAGIYYLRSQVGSDDWHQPILLYQSLYYRTINPADAHVRIANTTIDESQQLLVAWDNRSRNKIFFAKSGDGGGTWNQPVEVDSPEISGSTSRPFNVNISTSGANVLLVWQSSRQVGTCVQYSQWSSDGGETWEERHRVPTDIPGCLNIDEIVTIEGGLTFLFTSLETQAYILAWNGNQWNIPQLQVQLSIFIDPETANEVKFDCRRITLLEDARIFVLGCDAAEGGDIWMTSRPVGSVTDWFRPPSAWSNPDIIYKSGNRIASIISISDDDGNIHAFWNQVDHPSRPDVQSINYSRWYEELWTQPIPVVPASAGITEPPAVAVDGKRRLLMVWSEATSGELKFLWVNANLAITSSEWSSPQDLLTTGSTISSPGIFIGDEGTIYVTYAVPLNENRGVFLITSEDGGQSWTEPNQIFDGVAAGWEMVSSPMLIRSSNGDLHLIWTRSPLPGISEDTILYYALSEDGGITWSEPLQFAKGEIVWSQLISTGEDNLIRSWQENKQGRSTLWLESSTDQGLTWSRSAFIWESDGPVNITIDSSGQIHVLRVGEDISENLVLFGWVWDGEGWTETGNIELPPKERITATSLSATIRRDGLMVALVGMREKDLLDDEIEEQTLLFAKRQLELIPMISILKPTPTLVSQTSSDQVIEETPTPTPVLTPTPAPIAASVHTPTTSIPDADRPQETTGSDGIVMGAAGVIFLGICVAAYRVVRARSRK